MMCYLDMAFCEDACLCAVKEKDCGRKLTEKDAQHANHIQLPIAWMSFKDTCSMYKAVSCPQTK